MQDLASDLPQPPGPEQYALRVPDASSIQIDTEFEKDLFVYLPKVQEFIYQGRDVNESAASLARHVGIPVDRYIKIYQAAKKDIVARAELRYGSNLRVLMMDDCDREITEIRRKIVELDELRKSGLEALNSGDKARKDSLTIEQRLYAIMEPKDYYSIYTNLTNSLHKWLEKKSKLSGEEVQRKETINSAAKAFIQELYSVERRINEEMKKRSQWDLQSSLTIEDAEFSEIIPDMPPEIPGKEVPPAPSIEKILGLEGIDSESLQ